MQHVHPLPKELVDSFHHWQRTTYEDNKVLYRRLAEEGQHPPTMVISCCDSRVNPTALFETDQGDFFIHRNIANHVPVHNQDDPECGTASAIQYAVSVLKVQHILVIGHSSCGGVAGCYDMCEGNAPDLESPDSFVGRWINNLRPAYDRLPKGTESDRKSAMEKENVLLSLENLATYPFVRGAIAAGELKLHGIWNNTGEGTIEAYDTASDAFETV